MTSDYTPTTDDIALAWARDRHGWIGPEYIQPQFDRRLAAHDAEVAAKALEDAAREIPEQARRDECGLHLVQHVSELPVLSRIMLNGVTRAGERVAARAAAIREGADRG